MKQSVLIYVALVLLATSAACLGQSITSAQVQTGSSVYISPDHGFEGYLTAAFQKKAVPLVAVMDQSRATYIVMSDTKVTEPQEPVEQVGAPRRQDYGSVVANIRVIDAKTTAVIFSYSTSKNAAWNLQGAAEDCAKHLKAFIEKGK
jgi:hypothetical protein